MTNFNTNDPKFLSALATSREALKVVGDSAAVNALAFGTLTANQALAYQLSPQYAARLTAYMQSREKGVDKKIREENREWLIKEFEIPEAGKGAKPKDKFKFNNRIARIESAFKRAKSYAERKLEIVTNEKGNKFYITADSYRKIVPDHLGKDNVEITTMQEKDSVTWSGLMPAKVKVAATTAAGVVVTAEPENIAILCAGVKVAVEKADATKLDGSQKIAMLDAFFALQIMLNGKEDKALVTLYETLTNDPARKAS